MGVQHDPKFPVAEGFHTKFLRGMRSEVEYGRRSLLSIDLDTATSFVGA